jgi:mono/diheme cytochrome c family protein
MKRIVGYVWSLQFEASRGVAAQGKRVFESKGCGACHTQAGAPRLTGQAGAAQPFDIIAGLLAHGPVMLQQLQARKAAWPRFEGTQLADLLAYLNRK